MESSNLLNAKMNNMCEHAEKHVRSTPNSCMNENRKQKIICSFSKVAVGMQ